jgi:hypothetical protein
MTDPNQPTIFIDPFSDWSFKRLFGGNESKPILIGLLNRIFKGRKHITAIEYGKNEHPVAQVAREHNQLSHGISKYFF